MKFPWDKYVELEAKRKNTLQIFITNRCQLSCKGCFARNMMKDDQDISIEEYVDVVDRFKIDKDGYQINLIGGEPLLHPEIANLININGAYDLKTTIYTNGILLDKINTEDAKIRVSVYCKSGGLKATDKIPLTDKEVEFCYMVSSKTTLEDLVESANMIEKNFNCKVFFISSIRELDNERKEFFDDTEMTMNLLKYKELVHNFLNEYDGQMEIHISKRGVFESTLTVADNKCRFANYFIGGNIIQCPYDIVNQKVQRDYEFNKRYCQQSSSCLMSKIIVRRKR
jgi:organic radical activating enzyme